jgi:hypothetical protein
LAQAVLAQGALRTVCLFGSFLSCATRAQREVITLVSLGLRDGALLNLQPLLSVGSQKSPGRVGWAVRRDWLHELIMERHVKR